MLRGMHIFGSCAAASAPRAVIECLCCILAFCLCLDTSTFAVAASASAAGEAASGGASVLSKSPDLEFELEWPGRIVAVGDLHGDAENALLLLDALGVVDKETRRWKGGNTLLIQTGDIVDRGPDGKRLYDLFADLRQQATKEGGMVVNLLGNHDAMNVCGDFRYVHPRETAEFGGVSGRRAAFSEKGKYGSMLLSFPSAIKINRIVFSHAGVSPPFAALGLKEVHELLSRELKDNCSLYYKHHAQQVGGLFASGEDGPLWTRLYTLSPPHIGCPALEKSLQLLKADVMVVGHTVQESLSVETHCDGRLIGIDTGISRYVANSPRGIEVTPDGKVLEVSVHLENDDEDSWEEPTREPAKRRLVVRPLKFYTDREAKDINGSPSQEELSGNSEVHRDTEL